MFVSLETDCRGMAILLAALIQVNVVDGLRVPALGDEIIERVVRPDGLEYRTEQVDEWSTAAVERWRERRAADPRRRAKAAQLDRLCGAGKKPWRIDCEEFAGLGGAAFLLAVLRDPSLRDLFCPVLACITQPVSHRVAHAYLRCGPQRRRVDLAVRGGMHQPPDAFYEEAETAAVAVEIPTFAIWKPGP